MKKIKLLTLCLFQMLCFTVAAQSNMVEFCKQNPQHWKCDSLNQAPLPVQLTYFKARQHYSSVVCYWSTASELNASHYIVEGSEDGKIFTELSRVEATNSKSTSYYQIGLKHYPYYRLIQVDMNNQRYYYNMIYSEFKDVASYKGMSFDSIGRKVK